ncbi:SH3 domain-containing protein [Bacillus massilinigeriensis]|uniref:SH3 domain-containing protein n=1 Tax=Bacillus massilionigeriensis TaxID=1805475 RepID=UPI00096B1065|nr:SH3 domain-containing protein [Bacillus massilionigeriensis]
MPKLKNQIYSPSIEQSLNNIAQIDWASQTQGIQQTLNNIAQINWASQTQGIQQALNNLAQIDWASQTQGIQQALNNLAQIDWASQTQGIQQALNNIAQIDWASQTQGIRQALNNIAQIDWANYSQTLLSSIKMYESMNLANTFNQLSIFSVQEISEVLEEYEIKGKQKYQNDCSEIYGEITVNEKRQFSYDEIVEIVDYRLAAANSEKMNFKKFVQDLLFSYGQDVVKKFIDIILVPFFFILVSLIIDNHLLIIETIKESLSSGVYVVGYAHAKKVIKKEGLSRYENLNLIGLTRVDSLLRTSPNKKTNPVASQKVPLDTVVSVLEKKKNWLKIETYIDGEHIIGWIEGSKVNKFKRKK